MFGCRGYVTSTLDHVLTTSLPRSKNSRTWRGRGQNETISDFEVPTTSLLRPRHVFITSAPRPYYVLHVSTTSSIRAHQVHPVSTTSLLRPHKDQAVHTTRELRFQHVLTVNILIRILYILFKICLVCSYPFLPYSQPKTVISFVFTSY